VDQVRAYLRWRYDDEPWAEPGDFRDAELSVVRVDVRPEYEVKARRHPCPETVTFKVWLVKGRSENGLLLCSMPTLGVSFSYAEPDALKGLAAYYVQSRLRGLTPKAVSRLLPPPHAELDEVAVRVDEAYESKRADKPHVPQLTATASPLGDRSFGRRLSRPWERDAESVALTRLLTTEPVSVLLVGEGGCGKTSLLVESARRIERDGATPNAAGDKPDANRRRFWLTSGGRLIAGMKYLGQWQERVEELVQELADVDGWLCVERLLDLVTTGGEGPADSVAAFLAPYLERREVRLVAEATPAELDTCRRLLPGFVELLRVVRVPPMTRPQAVAALAKVAQTHGQNLKVAVGPGTVEQAYRLHSRFLPYQAFPGAASGFVVNLIEQAARERQPAVGPGDVVRRFVRTTGLPELFVRDELPLSADEVFATLAARVINQDAACRLAADVVTTFKAGMNDPGRPIGVLLFCGPTGVGKTELARAVADYLFGHGEQRDRMIRLDMSEYAAPGAADRLLTDSSGGPSELVRQVRQQPFNLLLLDEVEKADAEVFDVLLGLFDEGRLTDRLGRLTNFRSCVVVMTSNLGTDAGEPFGLTRARDDDAVLAAVDDFFRPEFVNRIDAVVPFRSLDAGTIRLITEKELRELGRREGLAKANLTLAWTPALVAELARAGFDRRYGARPLQRTIEQRVVTPLARFLVAHPGLRDATVTADVDGGGAVVLRR
ncbi:MAG TPA: AAA family ATPase, partial [Humisphaera sp.]